MQSLSVRCSKALYTLVLGMTLVSCAPPDKPLRAPRTENGGASADRSLEGSGLVLTRSAMTQTLKVRELVELALTGLSVEPTQEKNKNEKNCLTQKATQSGLNSSFEFDFSGCKKSSQSFSGSIFGGQLVATSRSEANEILPSLISASSSDLSMALRLVANPKDGLRIEPAHFSLIAQKIEESEELGTYLYTYEFAGQGTLELKDSRAEGKLAIQLTGLLMVDKKSLRVLSIGPVKPTEAETQKSAMRVSFVTSASAKGSEGKAKPSGATLKISHDVLKFSAACGLPEGGVEAQLKLGIPRHESNLGKVHAKAEGSEKDNLVSLKASIHNLLIKEEGKDGGLEANVCLENQLNPLAVFEGVFLR